MRLGSFVADPPATQHGARTTNAGPHDAFTEDSVTPWWAWPSRLAVDAPAVAVAWLWAVGHEAGHPVPLAALVLVAAAVWLAYVADRLLDVQRLGADVGADGPRRARRPSSRHAFFARHRRRFARLWTWVFGGAVASAAVVMTPTAFALGALVASLAVAAIAWNDRRTAVGSLGRCIAIGVAFAGAVAVGFGAPVDATLVPPLLGFAAVCASNVAWVTAWEKRVDDGHPNHAHARRLALALTVAALLVVSVWCWSAPSALGLAAWAALASLAVLGLTGKSVPAPVRSMAADLVLIVPLLIVLV